MDKAAAEGFIPAGIDPDWPISQLTFCQAVAKAIHAEPMPTFSPFSDTDDPNVLALVRLEIINGMDDGTFALDATIRTFRTSPVTSASLWTTTTRMELLPEAIT